MPVFYAGVKAIVTIAPEIISASGASQRENVMFIITWLQYNSLVPDYMQHIMNAVFSQVSAFY